MKRVFFILLFISSIASAQYQPFDWFKKNNTSFSFLNQTSNNQTVLCGSYLSLITTAANLGPGTSSREYFIDGQRARIRQDGQITKVRFSIDAVSSIVGDTVYIKFWRKNGSVYDYIGRTENLASLIANRPTISEITLSNPITVKEGDNYSLYTAKSSGTFGAISVWTGVSDANYTARLLNNVPMYTSYNWAGNGGINYYIPVELYIKSPVFVAIGNSLMAGHNVHYSFLEVLTTTNTDSTIGKELARLLGYTYQNMGIGSQTTANIRARFTADVVNLQPKFVLLEGGVNDVAGGFSSDSIIKNYTAMYDTCKANNIKVLQMAITPWGNGTTAQMQQIDSINTRLQMLCSQYSGCLFVNVNSEIGQFRAGGDTGNIWDIKSAYDDGGHIHFKATGYIKIAQTIYSLLR